MVYKVGSAVGAVGTVGGIGGTVVMANRETEPTKEQALKALSKEETIKVSTVVSAIPGIGESQLKGKETQLKAQLKAQLKTKIKDKKGREEVEKQDLKTEIETILKLDDFKDWKELKDLSAEKKERKNNFCEVVQKELFRRLAEKEFKLEVEKKDEQDGFFDFIKVCLSSEK